MASLISLLSLFISSSLLFNLFSSSSLSLHPISLFLQLYPGLFPSLSSLGGSILPQPSFCWAACPLVFFIPTCITALFPLHKIIGGLGFSHGYVVSRSLSPCRISSSLVLSSPLVSVLPLRLLAFLFYRPI